MNVYAGLCMYNVVVKKFTFAISSPDEFLVCHLWNSNVMLFAVMQYRSKRSHS